MMYPVNFSASMARHHTYTSTFAPCRPQEKYKGLLTELKDDVFGKLVCRLVRPNPLSHPKYPSSLLGVMFSEKNKVMGPGPD